MLTSTSITPKSKARTAGKRFAIGDRVTFAGTVLRVLAGEERQLLIMIDATGLKLTVNAHWFTNGSKLKGSSRVTLAGKVTRVGQSISDDAVPISVAVDGYAQSRVTLSAKSMSRA